MSLERNTQVLVVGAGPVGMTAALLLAQAGASSTVIDEEEGPAARSYACALHPSSLELFERLGLLDDILPLGRRVGCVAFYDGLKRRAEVRLSELSSKFPFLLVLPQNELEAILERALKRRAAVPVHWNHRLSDLNGNAGMVNAEVDQLAGSAVGYIVPHWEKLVKKTVKIQSNFLIGADGHNSVVRQRLGINCQRVGAPEVFAVFEFEIDAEPLDEVRVVLDGSTTSVLWPLPERRYRWSFQLARKQRPEEFPDKERRAFWIDDPERNWEIEQQMRHLIKERAPWFTANIKHFNWISRVQFEPSVVNRFGKNLCWLIGDAAHQTGPAGVQSLNVGLREADELVARLKERLQNNVSLPGTDIWEKRGLDEWKRLLGFNGAPKASEKTDPWVKQRAAGILPCIPASGDHLADCLSQLNLALP